MNVKSDLCRHRHHAWAEEGVQAAWMVTEDPLVAAFSVRMHVRCAGAHSIACPIHWLSGIPVAWLPLDLDIEEYAHPGAPCPRTERVVMSVSSETRHGRMPNALLTADAPLLFV